MGTTDTEEKAYMAESLNFINSVDLTYSYKYKDYFTPVLTNIVNDLIANTSLIDDMNKMITRKRGDKSNSNLKELIVKLTETKKIEPNKYVQINHNGNNAKYVEQCLKIIGITGSKKVIYELLNLVMQDLEKPENSKLMEKVKNFKTNNTEWKKMVGMLIPPGAQVNILSAVVEPINKFAVGKDRNKATVLTSRELIGTVVTRGKLDGTLRGGNFKKVVRLPKEITRNDNLAYKNEEIMVEPEKIELHVPNAEGSGEAVTGASGIVTVPGTLLPAQAPGIVTEPGGTPETASAQVGTAATAPATAQVASAPVDHKNITVEGIGTRREEEAPGASSAIKPATPQAKGTGVFGMEHGIGWEPPPRDEHEPRSEVKVGGGQQRTTRKHKNSIISSARKTRTNR